MHPRKQRGDFKLLSFFLVRCNTVCPTKLETRSQKETDGHFSSLCLLAACGNQFDFSWRGDPENAENTISFSSSRLVRSFVCNRASKRIQRIINVTSSDNSISSSNDFLFHVLILIYVISKKLNLNHMSLAQ